MKLWEKEQKVKAWVKEAFDANGIEQRCYSVLIRFSKRMTRCAGTAEWRPANWYINPEDGDYFITMSDPLWDRCDDAERRDTAIHEACHVLDHIINGDMDGHGEGWQACMRAVGLRPIRTHKIDRTGLKRVVAAHCPCGAVKEIGKIRAQRMATMAYTCRKCSGTIKLGECVSQKNHPIWGE
jgi:predicted SprT family Zn-dependent metalloprotease